MSSLRITAVSGGLWSPSKTSTLARAIAGAISDAHDTSEVAVIELGAFAQDLGGTLKSSEAPPRVATALQLVESADVLIAATPVFRGTFGGHFKHFFDLVDIDALRGRPTILAATGGGEKHCLVLEHALRPLFAFLGAFSLPSSVYATDKDFLDGRLSSPAVDARIQSAVSELSNLLPPKALSERLIAASG